MLVRSELKNLLSLDAHIVESMEVPTRNQSNCKASFSFAKGTVL